MLIYKFNGLQGRSKASFTTARARIFNRTIFSPILFFRDRIRFFISWICPCSSRGNCKIAMRITFIAQRSIAVSVHVIPYGDLTDGVRDGASTMEFPCEYDNRRTLCTGL